MDSQIFSMRIKWEQNIRIIAYYCDNPVVTAPIKWLSVLKRFSV